MTIICAVHEPGVGTWLGSDTAVFAGGVRLSTSVKKWDMGPTRAWASTGDSVIAHVTQELISDIDAMSLRAAWKRICEEIGGEPKKEPGEAPEFHVRLIMATPNTVADIDNVGSAHLFAPMEFVSAGCGDDFARGAWFATDGMPIKERVRKALAAAIYWHNGCGGAPWVHLLEAR